MYGINKKEKYYGSADNHHHLLQGYLGIPLEFDGSLEVMQEGLRSLFFCYAAQAQHSTALAHINSPVGVWDQQMEDKPMALKRKYVESAADAALVNLKMILTLKGENRPIVVDASVPASVYGMLEKADIEHISLASNRTFIAFEEAKKS